MFDFSKLLDSRFLFEPNPSSDFASKRIFLLIFGLIILISVLEWFVAHFTVKGSKLMSSFLKEKLFYLLLTLGIGGIVLVFFRLAGISYVSMRFIFLLFLFAILAWAVYLVIYLISSFPKEIREEKERKRKERYLPKRKKYD